VTHFEIRRIGGRIGAEITGVDLTTDLADSLIDELNAALLEHKALVFRGQHLTDDQQLAFACRFGPLTQAHPTGIPSVSGQPQVLPVDGADQRANHWHCDCTFIRSPPKASTLRAIVMPPYGGNTLIANAAAAYRDLPADLRELADRIWAVHGNDAGQPKLDGDRAGEYRRMFLSRIYQAAHPVVRIHPDSGEPSLFLGSFAQAVLGWPARESRAILDVLQHYVVRPENVLRISWSPGDITLFDNRNTQHYGPDDYGDMPRRLHRVTVAGDIPVGKDGRPSYIVEGDDAAHYTPAASIGARQSTPDPAIGRHSLADTDAG
jgi:alpha-ketoglutarate-dependent sulfate ester dioxygenase